MTLFYIFIIIIVNVFTKIKGVCNIPKILQNVREQLIAEARRQIAENGYKKTTVRSVAKACGLGVGTVYNYFNSKEMLIASFVADDWNRCLEFMRGVKSDNPQEILKSICTTLTEFSQKHRALFSDSDASRVFASVFNERHRQLRGQLAEIMLPVCEKSAVENKAFLSEFIAESILVWTMAEKPFDEQYAILRQLLK